MRRLLVAGMLLLAGAFVQETAAQHTEAAICTSMQEFAAKANKDAGSQVDTVTFLDGVAALCNAKTVTYTHHLTVPFSALRVGWEQRKRAAWNVTMCEYPAVEAVRAGWRIGDVTIDADGKRNYIEAVCQ